MSSFAGAEMPGKRRCSAATISAVSSTDSVVAEPSTLDVEVKVKVPLIGGKLVITAAGAGSFDYTVTPAVGAPAIGHASFSTVTTDALANNVTPAAGTTAADVQGQDGNDTLRGSTGDDRLLGGLGALAGGASYRPDRSSTPPSMLAPCG